MLIEWAPISVDEHAQDREEIGAALRLVDDDRSFERGEGEHRVGEAGAVARVLEIEPIRRRSIHHETGER